MADATIKEAEVVLDRFVEAVFKLMMDQHHQQIIKMDLTVPQAQALRVLRRGPLCTRDLAAALRISAPAVTQLTDRMERKHMLERRAVDGDRRSILIALTQKGREAIDGFRERRNRIFAVALTHLDGQDRADVVAALGKVVTALEGSVSSSNEGRLALTDREPETAVQPAKSSNPVSRAERGRANHRLKLEWD